MRTVFITGASSGIGAACAEVLASEKNTVFYFVPEGYPS